MLLVMWRECPAVARGFSRPWRDQFLGAHSTGAWKHEKFREYSTDHQKSVKSIFITSATTVLVISAGFIYKQLQQLDQMLKEMIPDVIKSHRRESFVRPTYIGVQPTYEHKRLSFKKKDWASWRHLHGHNIWLLTKLTQSEHPRTRNFIVEALASIHSWPWSDAEYHMIAQALDDRTRVALAHSEGTDLRFFLQPPVLPRSELSIEEQFEQLLSVLPVKDLDLCGKHFVKHALRKSPRREEVLSDLGGDFLEVLTVERSLTQRYMQHLQAVLSHSRYPQHCRQIVQHRGLVLLRRIYEDQKNHLPICRTVGKIIANLTLYSDLHQQIIQAGWVTIFAQWMQGRDLFLKLLAAKSLTNMDQEYDGPFKENQLVDGVYVYHPQHRAHNPAYVDVVFIPGLLGGPAWTWRQSGSNDQPLTKCWPSDWLAKDCPNIRMLTIEYDTSLSDWAPACPHSNPQRTLDARASEFTRKLREAGVGERPIIWVGHSMGGLLIKKILLMAQNNSDQDLVEKTKGVVFFSVPHKGSNIASWAAESTRKYVLFPSVEVKELVQNSPKLLTLHKQFVQLILNWNVPVLSFGEGQPLKIAPRKNGSSWVTTSPVPPESSHPGIGIFKLMADMNHLTICKPSSKECELYQQVLNFIMNCVPALAIEDVMKLDLLSEENILPEEI